MKEQPIDKPAFDKVTIGALAETFNRSFQTIERWIRNEDDRLTSEKARKVYDQFASRD